jgi:hypothetical protein
LANGTPSAFLGDLHIDPCLLDDYIAGRDQIYDALMLHVDARHAILVRRKLQPQSTTAAKLNHELTADYLRSFRLLYEVITGNHSTWLLCSMWNCPSSGTVGDQVLPWRLSPIWRRDSIVDDGHW